VGQAKAARGWLRGVRRVMGRGAPPPGDDLAEDGVRPAADTPAGTDAGADGERVAAAPARRTSPPGALAALPIAGDAALAALPWVLPAAGAPCAAGRAGAAAGGGAKGTGDGRVDGSGMTGSQVGAEGRAIRQTRSGSARLGLRDLTPSGAAGQAEQADGRVDAQVDGRKDGPTDVEVMLGGSAAR
jgi:hypothetical protein